MLLVTDLELAVLRSVLRSFPVHSPSTAKSILKEKWNNVTDLFKFLLLFLASKGKHSDLHSAADPAISVSFGPAKSQFLCHPHLRILQQHWLFSLPYAKHTPSHSLRINCVFWLGCSSPCLSDGSFVLTYMFTRSSPVACLHYFVPQKTN